MYSGGEGIDCYLILAPGQQASTECIRAGVSDWWLVSGSVPRNYRIADRRSRQNSASGRKRVGDVEMISC